jgi:hypothetical protein
VDVFDDHLPRSDRAQDFLPDGLLGDLFDEVARDRERDVGPSKATRTSRMAARTSASVSAPRPRSRSNTLPSRSLNVSNIQIS